MFKLINFVNVYFDDIYSSIIFNILFYQPIYTLIQFIEEICLLIISKDFRKLIKQQFIKRTQTTTVSTVFVTKVSPVLDKVLKTDQDEIEAK
jgi:hypothetical protein